MASQIPHNPALVLSGKESSPVLTLKPLQKPVMHWAQGRSEVPPFE
jgi:hypothetical protein